MFIDMTPVHKLKLTLLNLGTTRSISTKSFSEDCSPNAERNFFKFQALLLSCEMIKSIITIILIPISFLEMDDLSHVNLHSPIRPKPSTNIYPLPRLFFVYLLLSSLPLFTFCLCLCCKGRWGSIEDPPRGHGGLIWRKTMKIHLNHLWLII